MLIGYSSIMQYKAYPVNQRNYINKEHIYFERIDATVICENVRLTLAYYKEFLLKNCFVLVSFNRFTERPNKSFPALMTSLDFIVPEGLPHSVYSYRVPDISAKEVQERAVSALIDVYYKKLQISIDREISQRSIDERKDL